MFQKERKEKKSCRKKKGKALANEKLPTVSIWQKKDLCNGSYYVREFQAVHGIMFQNQKIKSEKS